MREITKTEMLVGLMGLCLIVAALTMGCATNDYGGFYRPGEAQPSVPASAGVNIIDGVTWGEVGWFVTGAAIGYAAAEKGYIDYLMEAGGI